MSAWPLLVIWATIAVAWAHPAIQVVSDGAGAVYFSDTRQVWRVTPDGVKSVVVPNVHTHELWLDPQGNLYGEHLEFHNPPVNGAQWSHRVWKRAPNGAISHVIATRPGFLSDYKDFSFHRDARNHLYWCSGTGVIQSRATPSAPLRTLANLQTSQLGWLSVLPDGSVIVSDHGALIRVDPTGQLRRYPRVSPHNDQHSLMGVWSDPSGRLYAASPSARAVVRISPAGVTTTVAVSPSPWQPVGGIVTADGAHWLLEVSPSNDQRLRRLAPVLGKGK